MKESTAIKNNISERIPPINKIKGNSTGFFKPFIQPKLTINQPNDIYEQEADAVAERVMRMPDTKSDSSFFQRKPLAVTAVQRKCAECENEEKLQRKENEEEQSIQLQRQCLPTWSAWFCQR